MFVWGKRTREKYSVHQAKSKVPQKYFTTVVFFHSQTRADKKAGRSFLLHTSVLEILSGTTIYSGRTNPLNDFLRLTVVVCLHSSQGFDRPQPRLKSRTPVILINVLAKAEVPNTAQIEEAFCPSSFYCRQTSNKPRRLCRRLIKAKKEGENCRRNFTGQKDLEDQGCMLGIPVGQPKDDRLQGFILLLYGVGAGRKRRKTQECAWEINGVKRKKERAPG